MFENGLTPTRHYVFVFIIIYLIIIDLYRSPYPSSSLSPLLADGAQALWIAAMTLRWTRPPSLVPCSIYTWCLSSCIRLKMNEKGKTLVRQKHRYIINIMHHTFLQFIYIFYGFLEHCRPSWQAYYYYITVILCKIMY